MYKKQTAVTTLHTANYSQNKVTIKKCHNMIASPPLNTTSLTKLVFAGCFYYFVTPIANRFPLVFKHNTFQEMSFLLHIFVSTLVQPVFVVFVVFAFKWQLTSFILYVFCAFSLHSHNSAGLERTSPHVPFLPKLIPEYIFIKGTPVSITSDNEHVILTGEWNM